MARPPKVVKPKRKFNYKKKKTGYRKKKSLAKKVSQLTALVGKPEIKQCRYNWTETFGSYQTTSFLGKAIQPLMPYSTYATITQGTGQSGRIGNKVRQVNSYVIGILTPLGYNATSNPNPRPLDVLMYIYCSRDTPNTLNSTNMTGFYNTNSGATTPSGTILDSISPINTDRYEVVYKRMFKVAFADYGGLGVSTTAQSYTNNDYKYSVRFRVNITKILPKVFRYNDNSDTPNNKIWHIAFLPMFADGSQHTSGLSTIRVDANWTINYTDA